MDTGRVGSADRLSVTRLSFIGQYKCFSHGWRQGTKVEKQLRFAYFVLLARFLKTKNGRQVTRFRSSFIAKRLKKAFLFHVFT